jgi:acetoin utilization protein AcuB
VIAYDATVAEAGRMMAEHAVRHLPVLRDGLPVGVLSDRDIAAVRSISGGDADGVRVAEAMTPVPYAVPPSMPLQRVARMMAQHRYGCAIVTDDQSDRVLGVFTITDALKALATILEAE